MHPIRCLQMLLLKKYNFWVSIENIVELTRKFRLLLLLPYRISKISPYLHFMNEFCLDFSLHPYWWRSSCLLFCGFILDMNFSWTDEQAVFYESSKLYTLCFWDANIMRNFMHSFLVFYSIDCPLRRVGCEFWIFNFFPPPLYWNVFGDLVYATIIYFQMRLFH